MATTYKVLNPRNIEKGVRILADNDGNEWYEEDLYVPPTGTTEADIDALVTKGFIAPVVDSG